MFPKHYISNNYESQTVYVEHHLYKKKSDNITLNDTNKTSKTINQYTTDVVDNEKTTKVSNLKKKTYYKFIGDVVIHNHNTMYTNDNINVTNIK